MTDRPALPNQVELIRIAKAMSLAGFSDWRFVLRPDGSREIIAGRSDAAAIGPDPDELLR